MRQRLGKQGGFFLVLAVVMILVLGFMGSTIVYLFSNRAQISVAALNGLRAFYLAESGLEAATRYLTRPSLTTAPARISCAALNGTPQLTNASLLNGTFTATTINSSPSYGLTTLSGAETSTDRTIAVTSTAGFAPTGRIVIDGENIDYPSISGNSFVNVTRGVNGTLASAHGSGAGVSQYQCSLDVNAGIPSIAAPKYQRELRANVQLQEGWIVGNTGSSQFTFSRWNRPIELDFTPSVLAAGSNSGNLYSVSMLSAADGWAVAEANGTAVILLQWNGSAWEINTLTAPCTGVHLRGVSMVSSLQGWAVGVGYSSLAGCANGSFRYGLLKFNGSAWSFVTPTTSPSSPANTTTKIILNSVSVIDTNGDGLGNVGFAVGDGGVILQYNGSNWIRLTSPTTTNLNSVYTVSSSQAWAVGDSGIILRWNGSTWSSFTSPVTTVLNSIVMLDTNGDGLADAGWIVGASERVLSYNGTSWTVADLGGTELTGVDAFNTDDVWAVGSGGLVIHWDGSSWTTFDSGTNRRLNAISLISPHSKPVSNWQQIFG